MPNESPNRISEILVLALLLVLNGSLALHVVGLQYKSFSWEAAALTYYYQSPTPTVTPTATPGVDEGDFPDGCGDGTDNDGNGLTDCGDPACVGTPPCLQPVPVTSWSALAVIALLLGVIGLSAMARPLGPKQ